MGKPSFREQVRADPRYLLYGALALMVYAAIGVVRPRWLTAPARRSPRQWVAVLAARLVFNAWYFRFAQPWVQRNERARSELTVELGREPTDRERQARVEQLEDADSS